MRQQIRNFVIQTREQYRVAREFFLDYRRYSRSAMPPESTFRESWLPAHRNAQVTKDYHRVEKGLALRLPKKPFGDAVQRRLEVGKATKLSDDLLFHAVSALSSLQAWNTGGKVNSDLAPVYTDTPEYAASNLFERRRSVRDFEERVPHDAVLKRIAEKALHTPSVCNRRPWNVKIFTGGKRLDVLALQNGNRGFGNVPAVAVVTVDTRNFGGAGERNQFWVDGGLFAMGFVLAAESEGIATCMLNWSVLNSRSDALRKIIGADGHDEIICLIAMGYARSEARVARSPRRDSKDVLAIDHS